MKTAMYSPPGEKIICLDMPYADQRRIEKRRAGVTKTTTPTGVENKLATRLRSLVVANLKLVINLVFFMSFSKKD